MRIGFGPGVARLNIDESVTGLWSFTNPAGIRVDDINESTPALGVLVDGVLLKDGGINLLGDVKLASRSPSTLPFGDSNDVASGIETLQLFEADPGNSRITGFAGGRAGRVIIVSARQAAGLLTIARNNNGSLVANRIWLPTADINLTQYDSLMLWYDGSLSRWVIIGSQQL